MSLCVRLASETLPVGQIVFWRNLLAVVPIAFYLVAVGRFPAALVTRRPGGHLVRGALGCIAMVAFFSSVARLPLALATALAFLAPLLSVPMAVLFLRERPGLWALGALLLGLAGTLLILLPAMEGPSLDLVVATGVTAGFLGALFAALVRVQIRDLTATEHPGAIAFYFSVIASILTLPSVALGWAPVDGEAMVWLAGAGIAGGLGQVALCEALSRGTVSRLAPLEYTGLVFAFALDLLVFGIIPAPIALLGAAMIVGASTVVAFRGRSTPRPPDAP
jgi:drug/metabolite transporter (DMT)-like permease